jgi:hypothetical protein
LERRITYTAHKTKDVENGMYICPFSLMDILSADAAVVRLLASLKIELDTLISADWQYGGIVANIIRK